MARGSSPPQPVELTSPIAAARTCGCMGTGQAFGVGPAWKQPDATHIVVYKQAETKTKELVGRVQRLQAVGRELRRLPPGSGGCFFLDRSRRCDTGQCVRVGERPSRCVF